MKYKLYTTSHKAWDAMFSAILGAKESIYLEMYILANDTIKTHDFFSLLKEKAEAGLEVAVIADSFGSYDLAYKLIRELKDSGAEFIFFSHWLKRSHRKILIVDKKIAFLGGVNIKEGARDWRDLQIKIAGAPARLLLKSFANSYYRAGGRKDSIVRFAYEPFPKKIKNWVLDNWPNTNKRYNLNRYYHKKISNAVYSLQIVTPYLLPPRWLLVAIDDACRRGVEVEMIVPKNTDIKALDRMNFINVHRLSKVGVKFYISDGMNHAKLMMIDNNEVAIGSQNFDILSFRINYEAGMFSQQKNLVADVRQILDKWKKEAVLFEAESKSMNFFDRILFSILKIFYPIF